MSRRHESSGRALALAAVGLLLHASPAAARVLPGSSPRNGVAMATVIRPITVTATAELSFGRLQGTGKDGFVVQPAKPGGTRTAQRVTLLPNGGETALVRALGGEPYRIYRVSLPESVWTTSGTLRVDGFTLWSATRRDITKSRMGAFNAQGLDTLRLGATLRVPKGTKQSIFVAKVPVTVAYE